MSEEGRCVGERWRFLRLPEEDGTIVEAARVPLASGWGTSDLKQEAFRVQTLMSENAFFNFLRNK